MFLLRRGRLLLVYVGPATQTVEMLEKMMEVGMSVVRMNFSHGSYEVSLATRLYQ